jgi:hypothetical protein
LGKKVGLEGDDDGGADERSVCFEEGAIEEGVENISLVDVELRG